MPNLRRFARTLVALAGALLVLSPSAPTRAGSQFLVVVIVGHETPIRNVSRAELRRLFMRDTDSIDGQRLVPLNHPPASKTRVAFDRLVLGMSEAEVGRYWIDRRIRGESGAPRTVSPPEMLRRVVSRLPNGITYLRSDELDDSVRPLTIDGKAPSHPDYPLK